MKTSCQENLHFYKHIPSQLLCRLAVLLRHHSFHYQRKLKMTYCHVDYSDVFQYVHERLLASKKKHAHPLHHFMIPLRALVVISRPHASASSLIDLYLTSMSSFRDLVPIIYMPNSSKFRNNRISRYYFQQG